ncbi:hypothetical protein MtrunA17_Chr5g0422811 [Medicago truncatula]|uniref:Transmembrane protein n=1 Tax=Medicago truncatula TaxID=3880 RepID=A0A396HR85_MEDTR|nr:hypothetical protein MtrunA17_Chr5g0422811 [Medicago truncatula]
MNELLVLSTATTVVAVCCFLVFGAVSAGAAVTPSFLLLQPLLFGRLQGLVAFLLGLPAGFSLLLEQQAMFCRIGVFWCGSVYALAFCNLFFFFSRS